MKPNSLPDTDPLSHKAPMAPPINPLKRSISFEAVDIQFEPMYPQQNTLYSAIPPFNPGNYVQHSMAKSDTVN